MNIFGKKKLKYINVDDIHYDIKEILSLDVPNNFIISPREPGKTSSVIRMLFRQFIDRDRRFVYTKRQQVALTESIIKDLGKELNKFLPDDMQIQLVFNKQNLKEGVCDIYVYPLSEEISCFKAKEDHMWFRTISLNIPADRFKGMVIPNLTWLWMDEFIINPAWDEKYLHNEFDKWRELYNTLKRSKPSGVKYLKSIWTGNPYSLFNPYFSNFGIKLREVKIGNIYKDSKYGWALQFVKLNGKLKEKLLNENPLLQLDDSYTRYAIEGACVNDENIKIMETHPKGFKLKHAFKMQNQYLMVYQCDFDNNNTDVVYWMETTSKQPKNCICFSPLECNNNIALYNKKSITNNRYLGLCERFRNYLIGYKDLNSYYMFLEIYEYIK